MSNGALAEMAHADGTGSEAPRQFERDCLAVGDDTLAEPSCSEVASSDRLLRGGRGGGMGCSETLVARAEATCGERLPSPVNDGGVVARDAPASGGDRWEQLGSPLSLTPSADAEQLGSPLSLTPSEDGPNGLASFVAWRERSPRPGVGGSDTRAATLDDAAAAEQPGAPLSLTPSDNEATACGLDRLSHEQRAAHIWPAAPAPSSIESAAAAACGERQRMSTTRKLEAARRRIEQYERQVANLKAKHAERVRLAGGATHSWWSGPTTIVWQGVPHGLPWDGGGPHGGGYGWQHMRPGLQWPGSSVGIGIGGGRWHGYGWRRMPPGPYCG